MDNADSVHTSQTSEASHHHVPEQQPFASKQSSSFDFVSRNGIDNSLLDHHQIKGHLSPARGDNADSQDINFSFLDNIPQHGDEEKELLNGNAYRNKLKYIPNVDFLYDKSYPTINKSGLTNSIPNTFHYKSHPNAKTKSALAIVTTNASSKTNSRDSLQQSFEEVRQAAHSSPFQSVFPPRKLDVIEDHSDEHNTTPDWMPPELNQKWALPNETNSVDNNIPGYNDFSSSVRITNPQNNELEWNLPSTTDTMVHNSNNKAVTPMWQRVHKEYELNKKSQPHLQSIFMSQNSNPKSLISNDRSIDAAKLQANRSNQYGNSISSAFSTPLGTINNKHLSSQPQPPSTVLNSNLPDSPLKLFGTRYNTFTKEKLNGLLAKMNTKTDLTPRTESALNNAVSNAPSMLLAISENNQNQLNGIKQFTEKGQYTDKQFIDNADKIFKNLKRRGFSQNFTQPSNYQSGTSTSTPRNDKLVKDIVDYSNPELEADEMEYSSYSSGFDTDSAGSGKSIGDAEEEKIQVNEGEMENSKANEQSSHNFTYTTTNNDFTTFTKLASSSQGVPEIDHEVEELQNEYTFDSFSEDAFSRELAAVENQNYAPSGAITNARVLPIKPMESQPRSHSSPQKGARIHGSEMIGQPKNYQSEHQTASSPEFGKMKAQILNLESTLDQLAQNMKLILDSKVTTPEAPTKEKADAIEMPENSILDMTLHSIQSTGESFDPNQTIKWKTASQLQFQRLHENQNIKSTKVSDKSDQGGPLMPINGKNSDNQPLPRGVLKRTADLPVAYDNMVLDLENHKWVSNDEKQLGNGSLDSIEDLVSYTQDKNSSIIKRDTSFYKNGRTKRNDSKLEVSFNLPGDESSIREADTTRNHPDVTLISRVDDVSFTQTVKKLVHAIAESLANTPEEWNEVTSVSLTGAGLDSVKDLERFLPLVSSLDISNNGIRVLDGVPSRLLFLKAEKNHIGDLTMFSTLHDLQRLNVSENEFSSLSALSSNIHLSHLNASKNSITSITAINNLVNLVELDLSLNNLMGELDFAKFNLTNLQDLNLSENKIKSVKGLESLPNLRILNLNENQMQNVHCASPHLKLKKLLLKLNRLKELDVSCYPYLRVLRIDGNMLTSLDGMSKLKNLDELSCKSQYDSNILDQVLTECPDITTLDISGNANYDLESLCNHYFRHSIEFLNINVLSLCAMDLGKIPQEFAKVFPNVRELNMNFNSISDITGLNQLNHLKKLYLVSNSIAQVEGIVKGLLSSRSTLEVIDVRLNPVNIELYPYVFNPHEMDVIQLADSRKTSPIHLETLDDIENFVIHYQSLNKSELEWAERDSQFITQIAKEPARVNQRINYEMVLVSFFNRLKKLDGSKVSKEMRHQLKHRFNRS